MKVLNKADWYGTKAQYLALSSIDSSKKYFIIDLPNYSISNADMELAITTESSLYKTGEVFICKDSGTYSEGHIYKFNKDTTSSNWIDISSNISATGNSSLVSDSGELTFYQNGQQVATKAEAILYKHNVSINGTNDSGQQINARVVGLNRSNVLVTTYGQLINMITGAVDYPLNGYVYNENNTLLGTILYFDYNVGNYFEFTVATSTGIEVIQLTTAQATISDTVAVVE